MRRTALIVSTIALAGCATSAPRVRPIPDSAWEAAQGSPRTNQPTSRDELPPGSLERERPRPPRARESLSREAVLDLATRLDAQDAIAEIDRHPLAFKPDEASLAWFDERLAPPELLDYLRKRARVDWDALAGPTETPPRTAEPEWREEDRRVVVIEPSRPAIVYSSPYPSDSGYYSSSYSSSSGYAAGLYVSGGYGHSGSYGLYGGRSRAVCAPTPPCAPAPYPTVYVTGTGRLTGPGVGRNPVVVTTPGGATVYVPDRPGRSSFGSSPGSPVPFYPGSHTGRPAGVYNSAGTPAVGVTPRTVAPPTQPMPVRTGAPPTRRR